MFWGVWLQSWRFCSGACLARARLLVSVCLARMRAFWVEERVTVECLVAGFWDKFVNIASLRVIQLAFGLFLYIYH